MNRPHQPPKSTQLEPINVNVWILEQVATSCALLPRRPGSQRRSKPPQEPRALVDAASSRAPVMATVSVLTVEPLERCDCTTAAAGPARANHRRRRLVVSGNRTGAVTRFRRHRHCERFLLLVRGFGSRCWRWMGGFGLREDPAYHVLWGLECAFRASEAIFRRRE